MSPASAPGTGAPVSDGLKTDEVRKIIGGLASMNSIGIRVALSTLYNHHDVMTLAGASITLK